MATIQFSTGQKVNFNGTPTSQDVEEVANKIGISKQTSAPSAPSQPTSNDGGIGGFVKSLVSAPATILARPVQAVAELAGAKSEDVDRITNKLTGGIVAPVPQNSADVEKDVGRGIQTAALGLGPVSGGTAFGIGNSLEQGNKLFSGQTAVQGIVGAVGGKLLDLVGKPLLDATGKVIGKITPDVIRDVVSKGSQAVEDFASQHAILPKTVSDLINGGADKLEQITNKPFDATADLFKKPFVKTPEQIVNAREQEISNIENNYANTRKVNQYSNDAGSASRKRIANTDVLSGSVDENGLIRTKQPGGAVEQYKAQTLDKAENVVRNNLQRLGETVKLTDVEKQLTKSVYDSGLEGSDLKTALNNVKKEVAGYRIKSQDGKVPLTLVHDAKISTTNGINYQTPPEIKTYRKAIANGLKKIVEDNSSFNVKPVNAEISKYLQDVERLENLDGKRVKGGKLGKYFSQISGHIAGSIAGGAIGGLPGAAAGSIIGGEVADSLKSRALSGVFGGETGLVAPKNQLLEEAIAKGKSPRLGLPAPKEGTPKIQIGSGKPIQLLAKGKRF